MKNTEVPNTPQGIETEDERLARIKRENEINKVAPLPPVNIGVNTTGVGQPTAQAVSQGQSLPQTVIPVEKKFADPGKFYHPEVEENATVQKGLDSSGSQKTDT